MTGTLDYAGQRVATGTMAYKYKKISEQDAIRSLTKTSVNLKMIPDVNFQCKVAQLVKYNLIDVNLKVCLCHLSHVCSLVLLTVDTVCI